MMKFRLVLSLVLVAALGFSQSLTVRLRAQEPQPYDFTELDAFLQRSLPQIGGDGCALLLIQDGKVIYRKAFGKYTTEQVEPIASATKWLSGAVLLALADEGKLSLDDPASKFLPNYVGEKGTMTIRQMFSHTAGTNSNSLCAISGQGTLEQCVNQIAILPLASKPGTQFAYGNVSMHIGGRIAEIVSGKSWDAVFKEKIADPLGMKKTDYEGLGVTDNPLIAGGAESCIDDYGAFLQMLLNRGTYNGKRVLSEKAIDEMFRDQTKGVPIAYTPYQNYAYLNSKLPETRYGIGHWLEVVDPQTNQVVEHSSQGAFGCSPWIDLKRNLAGVFLVKSQLEQVMPVYLDLKDLVHRLIPEKTNSDTTPPAVASVSLSKAKVLRKKDPTVTITWKSTDNIGVTGHGVLYAGDGTNFTTTVATGLPGGMQSFTWTISDAIAKTKSGVVKIQASDGAGNLGEAVSSGVLIIK
ncbi:MAG: serine hydrolase [Blastocatellia bacterium]|nr:serine hydrolase [Blastocatellia bacterium]